MNNPNRSRLLHGATLMLLTCFAGFACNRPTHAATDVPLPEVDLETESADPAVAVIAGGCFWCTEAVFEEVAGISSVVSGYAGGVADDANYRAVANGLTDHAEAIAITYDPAVISYGQILQLFFAVAHDPTQLNRQGNDIGKQYRSTIFFEDDGEKKVAETYIQQLEDAEVFNAPIVTTLEPLTKFYPAEDYHQDYAANNPNQPYVAFSAIPKVKKLRKHFPELLKPEE